MTEINIKEILKYLPHRYPFLLVDRVLEYKKGESLLALKNVTNNEPFFTGHFPGDPVMPGVLVIESLAQAAGILTFITKELTFEHDQEMFYFAGIDKVRFRRIIVPGDQLKLKVEIVRHKLDIWRFKGEALVGDELACSAEIMIAR